MTSVITYQTVQMMQSFNIRGEPAPILLANFDLVVPQSGPKRLALRDHNTPIIST
jgi:hypothetical protein